MTTAKAAATRYTCTRGRATASERSLVPHTWRLGLAGSRALLAVAFLFAEQHPLWFPLTGRGLFYAAFVIYSLIALSTRRLEDGAYALLRLVLDVIFFLICASGPPDHGGWLTTLLFLFLMVTATLFHDWREVTIIFGLTLLFLWVTAPDEVPFLWLAIVTLGLLSLIFSLHKRLLKERLAMASRQAVM